MQHLDNVHRQLGELGVLSAKTERTEREILSRAMSSLDEQRGMASELRAGALAGEPDAIERYQACIQEQGRLKMIIAQAREVLRQSADGVSGLARLPD